MLLIGEPGWLYIARERRFPWFPEGGHGGDAHSRKTRTVASRRGRWVVGAGWRGRGLAAVTPQVRWRLEEVPGSLDGAVHGLQWRRPFTAAVRPVRPVVRWRDSVGTAAVRIDARGGRWTQGEPRVPEVAWRRRCLSGGEERRRWTVEGDARGQGKVSARVVACQRSATQLLACGRLGRKATRCGADACKTRALAALWTCTPCARRFANGTHSDPYKLTDNRMGPGFMVITMDKLEWPGGQVCCAR